MGEEAPTRQNERFGYDFEISVFWRFAFFDLEERKMRKQSARQMGEEAPTRQMESERLRMTVSSNGEKRPGFD